MCRTDNCMKLVSICRAALIVSLMTIGLGLLGVGNADSFETKPVSSKPQGTFGRTGEDINISKNYSKELGIDLFDEESKYSRGPVITPRGDIEHAVPIENPADSGTYEEGWDAGYERAVRDMLRNLDQYCGDKRGCADHCTADMDVSFDDCMERCDESFTDPEGGIYHCGDGRDNDYDGVVDCADEDCLSEDGEGDFAGFGDGGIELWCAQPENETEHGCLDRFDNDGDLAVDCDDSDCATFVPTCAEGIEGDYGFCDDGNDNDSDGLRDCEDPDCQAAPECRCTQEVCDGVDNDCDGLVDEDGDEPVCPQGAGRCMMGECAVLDCDNGECHDSDPTLSVCRRGFCGRSECVFNDDCGNEYECRDGFCFRPCFDVSDCRDGIDLICSGGYCIPRNR